MPRRSIEEIRRPELIEAALSVIAAEGHDAATTQKIAAKAGTSPGIVHHYFGDKHRLMCAAMREVRRPVAAYYRGRLHAAGVPDGTGRAALDACLDAHLDPEILTMPRAATWLHFAVRVPYVPDYARIHSAVRCRQVAAMRRALLPLSNSRDEAAALARRLAIAIDGHWLECATREGGLRPGEARSTMSTILSDSIW